MATPTHGLPSGVSRNRVHHVGVDRPASLADNTEVIPRLSWFRKRQAKHRRQQEQQIILRTTLALPKHRQNPTAPLPQLPLLLPQTNPPPAQSKPLDRGEIHEAINKHGWIRLP